MTRRRRPTESIYCECCGGTIVECGCTWRGDYCMKHAQRCPRERPQEPKARKLEKDARRSHEYEDDGIIEGRAPLVAVFAPLLVGFLLGWYFAPTKARPSVVTLNEHEIECSYIGSAEDGTIVVEADGDLVFKSSGLGAGQSFLVPAQTTDKMLEKINATPDWRCKERR